MAYNIQLNEVLWQPLDTTNIALIQDYSISQGVG